jgi:hypothetical protein
MHLPPLRHSIPGPGGELVLSKAEGSVSRAPRIWDLFDQPVKIELFNTLSLRLTPHELTFIAGWSLLGSRV